MDVVYKIYRPDTEKFLSKRNYLRHRHNQMAWGPKGKLYHSKREIDSILLRMEREGIEVEVKEYLLVEIFDNEG